MGSLPIARPCMLLTHLKVVPEGIKLASKRLDGRERVCQRIGQYLVVVEARVELVRTLFHRGRSHLQIAHLLNRLLLVVPRE